MHVRRSLFDERMIDDTMVKYKKYHHNLSVRFWIKITDVVKVSVRIKGVILNDADNRNNVDDNN